MLSVLVSAFVISSATPASAEPVGIQVEGDGYMRFARDGEVVYAKTAELTVRSGKVCSVDGPWVLPVIVVEGLPKSMRVTKDGKVMADFGHGEDFLGRLVLAVMSDDVRPVESRGFLVAFDKPKLGEAGDPAFGEIQPWSKMDSSSTRIKEAVSGHSSGSDGKSSGEKENSQNRVKVYAPESNEPKSTVGANGFKPNAEFLKSGGVQVVLSDSATVDADRVRLGEIATVYAKADLSPVVAAVDLGQSPIFGIPRTITADRIKTALIQAGIDQSRVQVLGRQTNVSRAGQVVTQAQFEEVAKSAVRERFGDFDVETSGPVPDLQVPMGEIRLSADNVVKSGNSVMATVTAYVDGKRINSRTIKLYNSGVPVTLKQGDSVTVLIRSNDVGVEASGKVRKVDGVTGEVTVQLETGAILTGKVNKKGQVEVSA